MAEETKDVNALAIATMLQSKRKSVAFHEAGQAVVALSFGLQVSQIRIAYDNGSGETDISPADHLSLIEQIAVTLAGINAQKMFDAQTHLWAGCSDMRKVRKLVQGLRRDESRAVLVTANGCARHILSAHKEKVCRIAAHLSVHRTANAEEVCRMYAS